MRYSVQLPTDRVEQGPEFTTAEAVVEMARAVEAAGFDACYVTEHPFPADDWLATGGHHALDPFVALSAAAVATERLLLHTNILVLAYRNPFLTAKAVASLDALSGGRVILGVAAGYLQGEYRALGADFANRNEITDEAIAAMKRAWTGESIEFRGLDYEALGNTMLPAPVQRPHPPLWVGGNTKRAIRRAAECAQGWSPFPVPRKFRGRARTAAIESIDDLAEKIAQLNDEVARVGRTDTLDVNFVPFGRGMNSEDELDAAALREQMQALEKIGVTWVSVGVPCASRESYLENLARFGREVIASEHE